MIFTNAPEIWGKIRERFGVETGPGQQAELLMSIQPVTNLDMLTWETRVAVWTMAVSENGVMVIATVPAHEIWHPRNYRLNRSTGGNNSEIRIAATDYSDPAATRTSVGWAASVAVGTDTYGDLLDNILRPGDALELHVDGYASTGNTFLYLKLDVEPCGS